MQEVRILSSSNWRPINARLEHSANIREDKKLVVYSEVNESSTAKAADASSKSRYIVCDTPMKLLCNKAPAEKPNPKIGVGVPHNLPL